MRFSTAPVGSICNLLNGKAFKPTDWSEAGEPIIRIQNLNDAAKPFNYWAGPLDRQVLVKPGDVLFAWSGTPGTSFGGHVWKGPGGVLNQHIFRVDLDERKITREWFVAAIKYKLNVLIDQAHGGVGLQHVTRPMVDKLEIPLPPLDEQRRIAAILDQAEALRLKRQETSACAEQLIQSAFLHLFGNPIQNPKNFEMIRLGSMVDQKRGISYGIVQRGKDLDRGIPVLRISDISDNFVDPNALKQTSTAISEKYRRTILKGGEIAISIRGTVGRCCVVGEYLRGANVSREVAVIPYNLPANSDFLLSLIRTDAVQARLTRDVKGIAQSGINLEDLRELPVIQPPERLVGQFLDFIRDYKAIQTKSLQSANSLDALFASLQHRAFNGEL